jgi:hydrophobic/amphiphilic exporter-1 (mainly G- bacteria), HAE1 family
MNLPEFSIRRPVTTTLMMAAILLFGILGFRLLPVSDLPNVDFPIIVVSAALPGANPETMASAVATPLEKQFATIAGIDSMTSSSGIGVTQITLQFNLSRSLDAAAQDVQAAISAVQRQLPQNMPSPPAYQKVNPADQPILFIALTSPDLPLYELDEFGETLMAQRISEVSGVAQVLVYGAQKYAVRVQLDPTELAHRGIGIDEVAGAVQNANVNLPTGTLYGEEKAYTVQANGQLMTAEPYLPTIVAYRNGHPVRLREIGTAINSVENDKTAAWFVTQDSNQRSVILAVQRQPGTNTVQVAKDVLALLPSFGPSLPESVKLHLLYDRSVSIRDAVHDVEFTLIITLALVVMVIFLFLRSLRATVIPSMALPMSVIGTFAVMYLLSYSLDNLSLMALVLAVGFVVDDAIVMLENIVRHVEMGESVFEASLSGSREIGFTIISMTLSLAAVFIPVLFMGGLVGRLIHEFAVTIGVAILISGFISLTLTPMLCSRFLRPPAQAHHGRIYAASERVFNGMLHLYDATLTWALRRRATMMGITVLTLIGTLLLFVFVPKGFIATEDYGLLLCWTEAAEGISFKAMAEHQQQVAEVIAKDPNVESFMSTAGRIGVMGSGNTGIVFLRLKPRSQRALSADEIVQELRPKLDQIPGIVCRPQNPPPIQTSGRISQGQYQFTLQSADAKQLYRYAPILEAKVRALPGFQDVTSDLRLKNPQINLEIERDKASALGVSAAQIELALYDAYGTRQISTIYAPGNTYQVIMELLPEYQLRPESLSMLYVQSTSGKLVPLNAVARLESGFGPLSINHSGQLPSVTISFNLTPGVPLGNATQAVSAASRELGLPASVTTNFQGEAKVFQSSFAGLGMLLVMAVLVIYMVLGILYESFIHPLTILSGLPSAGVGALLTLLIFHEDLGLYAFVGIIMLVGLVKKNGIMMIDFALEAQRREGKPALEAIHQACLIRFRPIMMTTMAALMAAIPIALGWGTGGGARRPLGMAVVGGLLFSQLLTLYITPVFFLYMESFRGLFAKRGRQTATMDDRR